MSDETTAAKPSERIAARAEELLRVLGEPDAPDADPRSGAGVIAILEYLDMEAERRAAWEKSIENRVFRSAG